MKKILVVGDVMLDSYIEVAPKKLSEEAPVIIMREVKRTKILGGAGNVAANLVALGINTTLYGIIGEDPEAGRVEELLEQASITSKVIRVSGFPTIVKRRIICEGHQLMRLDRESSTKYTALVTNVFSGYDLIVISDYNKSVVTPDIMKEIKRERIPILVNGKPDNMFLYSGVNTLIINKKEKKEMLLQLKSPVIPEPTVADLASILKIRNVIVTYGEDGICSYTEQGLSGTSLGYKVSVRDITGAGDVVTAIVAYCTVSGQTDMQKIIDLANYGGSIKVQREKTAIVTLKDIEPELEDSGVFDYDTQVQKITKEPEDT